VICEAVFGSNMIHGECPEPPGGPAVATEPAPAASALTASKRVSRL
jgi:hypothetical protein